MKRIYKSLFRAFGVIVASSALMVAGCTTDPDTPTPEPEQPEPEPDPTEVVLEASVETTRTSLNEYGEVLWTNNDQLRVWSTSYESSIFNLISGANSTVGSFKGLLPEYAGIYYAGYPAEAWHDDAFVNIPAEQRYKRGTFANNTNPMLAVFEEETTDIEFKNLFGIIKLQLTGTGTVDNIVVDNEGYYPMSGEFSVDSATYDVLPCSEYAGLTLTDVNVTLGETPEEFYILVPPASYKNLKVTVNCTDGTSFVRTADREVTIGRNEVLPLAPIAIEAEPEVYLVDGKVNAERSCWNYVSFDLEYQEECADAYIGWATTAYYEQIMGENINWTAKDLLENGAINYMGLESKETCDINIQPGVEYTFVFLGYDAEDNYEFVVKNYISNPVFADPNGVEIVMDNINSHDVHYHLDLASDVKNITYALFVSNVEEFFSEDHPRLLLLNLYQREAVSVDPANGMAIGHDKLTPNSDYTIALIAEHADGRLSYDVQAFHTPVYEYSDVWVGADIETLGTSIKVTLGGDWHHYKYMLLQNTTSITTDHEANLHTGNSPEQTAKEFEVDHLIADTQYLLVILPYDSDGKYGAAAMYEIWTSLPWDVSDSKEYRSYIGQWNISFYDNSGQYYENYATLTIEEESVGSSYVVRGLGMGHAEDDALRAYFEDGKFYLVASERIAYAGDDYGYAKLLLVDENLNFADFGYLEGTLNNGSITFESSVGEDDYIIISYYDYGGNRLGYYPPVMKNNVWTKVKGEEVGSSTEDYVVGDSVDAGWE